MIELESHRSEVVDRLEPLFSELHAHQATLPAAVGGARVRTAEEAWSRRRALYLRWLAEPSAAVLLATHQGQPAGYAFVAPSPGYAGWDIGDAVLEVKDLVVTSRCRRHGMGRALLAAVERHACEHGFAGCRLNVLEGSSAASFYEASGFVTVATTMLKRLEGPR